MESVSVSRTFDADPDAVREAMTDVERFMAAAGFDEVTVDGDDMTIVNGFSLAAIELKLALVDRDDAELAYEQDEGIFEEMWTTYEVEPVDDGTRVTATTEFALDVAVVGAVLDATVIERQRRRELTTQFDWLERTVSE
ncbi:MAG: SRPBCC family protein [Halorientalis sp.]